MNAREMVKVSMDSGNQISTGLIDDNEDGFHYKVRAFINDSAVYVPMDEFFEQYDGDTMLAIDVNGEFQGAPFYLRFFRVNPQ